jgi:excisionase family DNA binding protein
VYPCLAMSPIILFRYVKKYSDFCRLFVQVRMIRMRDLRGKRRLSFCTGILDVGGVGGTQRGHMPVKDLQSHSEPYVTVAELAEYWLVGRKQIYKQIEAGTLPAIRLGPRLLRIRTVDARAFERSASMRVSRESPFASAIDSIDDRRRA